MVAAVVMDSDSFSEAYIYSVAVGGFSPRLGSTYAVGTAERTPPQQVASRLREVVFAERLPNQLILEPRDSLPSAARKEVLQKTVGALRKVGAPFFVVFSGGKSYHLHVFFPPEIIPRELHFQKRMSHVLGVELSSAHFLFLLLKEVVSELPEVENYDEHLIVAKTCMFPLPERVRRDKPKPTKLVMAPQGDPIFDTVEVREKARELARVLFAERGRPKSLRKMVKEGAPKGKRDTTALKVYFKAMCRYGDHGKAKEAVRKFLENSEPKGVWDSEKERILRKVDSYWKEYFRKYGKCSPEEREEGEAEEKKEGLEELLKEAVVEVREIEELDGFSVHLVLRKTFGLSDEELKPPTGEKYYFSKLLRKILQSLSFDREEAGELLSDFLSLKPQEAEALAKEVVLAVVRSAKRTRVSIEHQIREKLKVALIDKAYNLPPEKRYEILKEAKMTAARAVALLRETDEKVKMAKVLPIMERILRKNPNFLASVTTEAYLETREAEAEEEAFQKMLNSYGKELEVETMKKIAEDMGLDIKALVSEGLLDPTAAGGETAEEKEGEQ